MTVRIADDAIAAIVEHARAAHPAECCGYVRGRDGLATEAVACRNAQPDGEHPTHPERTAETGFVIAGRELFDFARSFATERPPLVVYHSHTNGRAYFSGVDRENALGRGADGRLAPVYRVAHLVIGVTAGGVTEAALFEWDGDRTDFAEVARFAPRC